MMRAILNDFANLDITDLGVRYTPDTTTFKVWAPLARQAEVAIYLTLDQTLGGRGDFDRNGSLNNFKRDNPDFLIPMTLVDNVWVAEHDNNEIDLDGAFYLYKLLQNSITDDGIVEYVLDPYATAAVGNGRVSAIIDFAKTPQVRPLNRELAPVINTYTDHVIYEIHVRDFSIHPSSGISEENKGKFLAFTERGTTAKDPVTGAELLYNGRPIPTGLDHLIELGITTVHLLPIFDINSLNELRVGDWSFGASNSFNWGYDPLNYNALEGSYSSDPRDPYARVNEFKELVSVLHDVGIRVVIDVVYNHTANMDAGGSPFRTAPGYFYRTWDNGSFVNPGFGNDVATERAMVRKFIIDSVLWWQSEFKVDGFRFDLMGCHDYVTMEEVVKALRAVDPEVIVYGEPWDMLVGIPRDQTALVGTQMNKGWAFYNDQLRNAVRGGNRDAGKGFAHGARTGRAVATGVTAGYRYAARASEIVNYVSKHDDLILWDTTVLSLGNTNGGVTFMPFLGTGNPTAITRTYGENPHSMVDPNDIFGNNPVRAAALSQGIVFTSQGIPFFAGGCEFLRSKQGNADSYNSGDIQNALRWYQKAKFMPVFKFYQGLIELRSSHPAFRLDELSDISESMELLINEPHVVAYVLKDHAGNDTWKNIFVAYNGSFDPVEVDFGTTSNLTIVVNHEAAGIKPLGTIEGGVITLPPLSMIVAYEV
jgi:pullulanase